MAVRPWESLPSQSSPYHPPSVAAQGTFVLTKGIFDLPLTFEKTLQQSNRGQTGGTGTAARREYEEWNVRDKKNKAMWLKWTCFNTSHSLGLIAFSTFYCIKSSEAFRFYSLNAKNAHLLVTERPLKPRIAGVSRCLRSQTITRSSFHSPQLKVQSWPWKCCRKSYLLGPSGAFFFF